MFCRHTITCCSVLCYFCASVQLQGEDLTAGLKDRIGKTQAELVRLAAERRQSEKLLTNGEGLLARAQEEKDQEAVVVVKRAIAKAQQAIASCENSIASARGRIEALTGALATVEAIPAPAEPVIPASVVDLRDVKDFTIDPANVKGYPEALRDSLSSKAASAVHAEIKARAGGTKSNLATMSYAQLMADLGETTQQGLKQGEETRQQEADQKLRTALQIPADIKDDLLDLFLPPEPAATKLTLPEQIKTQALRVLHYFDRVRNDEKERVWLAYKHWQVETELAVNRVRDGRITEKEYEDAYKLNDQKFLFTLTAIGKIAGLKEDEEIGELFPQAKTSSGGRK